MRQKRSSRFSKLYTVIAIMICMFAFSNVAYGAFTMTSFTLTFQYPSQGVRTKSLEKSDDSPGIVENLTTSPGVIKVEMWGSDGDSGNYKNFTAVHEEEGYDGATYYYVDRGEISMLHNTIYEYYNHPAHATLYVISHYTGNVYGRWAAMTN